jgi:hypothetical protein
MSSSTRVEAPDPPGASSEQPLKTAFDALEARRTGGDISLAGDPAQAGLPTVYAANTPHEDFAEAVLHTIAGAVINGEYRVKHRVDPIGALGKNRRQFLVDKGLLPADWDPATAKLYHRDNLEVSPKSNAW